MMARSNGVPTMRMVWPFSNAGNVKPLAITPAPIYVIVVMFYTSF